MPPTNINVVCQGWLFCSVYVSTCDVLQHPRGSLCLLDTPCQTPRVCRYSRQGKWRGTPPEAQSSVKLKASILIRMAPRVCTYSSGREQVADELTMLWRKASFCFSNLRLSTRETPRCKSIRCSCLQCNACSLSIRC